VLAALIQLGHVPEDLISEVNKQATLANFGQHTSQLLIITMNKNKLTRHLDFYEKLWSRVEQGFPKYFWTRTGVVIHTVLKF
jgi:hypothetical protein